MTEQKKVRALRMHSVTGDGQPNKALIRCILRDPRSGEEMIDDETGEPLVYVMLRPIDRDEHNEIIRGHTKLERVPGGKNLAEFTDGRGVDDEVMRRAIQSWHGLIGADDKALVCNDQTKVLLDQFVKLHLSRKLFGLEAAEVAADTFRTLS